MELLDTIDNQVYELVKAYIEELFNKEERFVEYYMTVLSNEDRIREVVMRFIKYALPKLIAAITEYPDPVDPKVLALRNSLMREVIDNALSRAFCEVIHL